MLTHIPFPALPVPPSWYPGHMTRFFRQLPALLARTDVVIELRDSRLPLTSINSNLEGALSLCLFVLFHMDNGCHLVAIFRIVVRVPTKLHSIP